MLEEVSFAEEKKINPKLEEYPDYKRLDFSEVVTLDDKYGMLFSDVYFDKEAKDILVLFGFVDAENKIAHLLELNTFKNIKEFSIPSAIEYHIPSKNWGWGYNHFYNRPLGNLVFKSISSNKGFWIENDIGFNIINFKFNNPSILGEPKTSLVKGNRIYVYGTNGEKFYVWDGKTGDLLSQTIIFKTNNIYVNSNDFVKNIAEDVISNYKSLNINYINTNLLSTNNVFNAASYILNSIPKQNISKMAVNPSGTILATFVKQPDSDDKYDLYFWAISKSDPTIINSEKPIFVIKGPFYNLQCIEFSFDSQFISVSFPYKNPVYKIYNTITGDKILSHKGNFMHFHPNYNIYASSDEQSINVVFDDLESKYLKGVKTVPFNMDNGFHYPMNGSFSPNGSYFACFTTYWDKESSQEKYLYIYNIDKELHLENIKIKEDFASKYNIKFNDNVFNTICNYNSDSLRAIIAKYDVIPAKNEFETTAVYNGKVKNEINNINNRLIFLYENACSINLNEANSNKRIFRVDSIGEYEADNKQLKIYSMNNILKADVPIDDAKRIKSDWSIKALSINKNFLTFSDCSINSSNIPEYQNLSLLNNNDGKKYQITPVNKFFNNLINSEISNNNVNENSRPQKIDDKNTNQSKE